MQIPPYDPVVEEFDEHEVEIYEGEPDFERPQADNFGFQDDEFEEVDDA